MIDWNAPWFADWRVPGERVAARVEAGRALHDALNDEPQRPLTFVAQAALPSGTAYERHVHDSGTCPTRPGLHDFFNGLCWLRWPKTKRRLNELQAAQITAAGVGAVRGPVRDAITVFDENGAVLDAPPALWEALDARDWNSLFVELRPLWAQARLQLVGHALLEKLTAPRKPLTAHVWRGQLSLGDGVAADACLAEFLTAARLAQKPFAPLPVLGVPGWWPANQNFCFYDDSLVFRPRSPAAKHGAVS